MIWLAIWLGEPGGRVESGILRGRSALGAHAPLMLLANPAWLDGVNDWLKTPIVTLGDKALTFGFLARALLAIFLIVFAARLTRSWLVPRILRRTKVDIGVQHATARIASYIVWILGAMVALPLIGLPINSVVFAFSALGVGLGFGLQNIADNFVSGLILLFERPVKVGDRIQVGDLFGTIVEIRARSTVIETNENVSVLLPNSELISKNVVNLTHNGPMVRFRFAVGVSYKSDVDEVREALMSVAMTNKRVLKEPVPEVLFMGFGDSSLDFVLRVGVTESAHRPDILRSEINFAIWHELKRRGIEIPFPQRDLHLRSVQGEAAQALRGAGA